METGDWGKKDRLSHRTSIGVVGNGFVGGAVVNGFGTYCIVNVFDSDPENLANYYYLIAQLQAAQPWSGNMLEVLPIAEKAVAMASNLYGSNSDKALRARGITVRILSYALTRTSAPKERKRL